MGGSGRSGGGAGDSGGAGPETPVARALAAALYGGADDDAALDTGASLLAAADPDEAGRELLRRGEEYVRRAWERGWLPADLDREARRQELDPAARTALAELTAAELARYGNGLTPLWRRQLDALAAPAWAGTGGRDRFARATAVLQALRLLLRLPALEPLGPPPGGHPSGAAAAPPRTPGGEAPEDRMLGRIRALLAKAEATGYPPEAEALTAKAQELMARHSVDEAQLSAGRSGGADAPGARRISVDPPYETAKAILLDAVARANRCQAVWNEELAFSTVVGHEADLEPAELLYTSLLVQAATAMSRAEAAQRAGGRKRTKTFRQSFMLAYAHRLGDRLAETARAATETLAAADLLPVLAGRDLAVTEETRRLFPRTTTTRVRGADDRAGWDDGTRAADRAGVDGHRGRIDRG
ncbi:MULTISPECIES: DUF2786 domain-containing protein [Streptomyces]|uniref:DUF2786 domain-containing protein n=1 Tax=Streptomyces odorifer TaxID=53450 RepID=A0A7Y6KKK6_9ACTN|nr:MULTISPECIES: DUF2786 domain-containing protein [Streptomyces]NUV34926.1 DUF2786 domain-containing protein [Streptomyces sp. KAI-27]NUV47766.1 DUF2786 domain-containing protein [Streptomyces sp. CAI-78]MCG5122996.1 DUF2786 domain-containing protein [Streptomyces sp. T7(2022)]NUV32455.1 DUF2786 domain-containing protein [Streptomyces odorifer]UDF11109.1 DUF2786 domain-containing protein [Streptomyces sp. WA1-19]